MLAELLRDHSMGQYLVATGDSFLQNEFNGRCANLAGEILTAVGQFKQGSYLATLAGDDDTARNEALALLGINALRNFAGGWPEVPGLCFFNDEQRASVESAALQALLAAASGSSSGFSSPSSLASFEPFFPASDSSLAAGLMALELLRGEREAAESAPEGASALDNARAEP